MDIIYKYDLSVCIPCHNLQGYIGRCIESILSQDTNYTYEIIFICDCCSDNTRKEIEEKMQNSNIPYHIKDSKNKSCGWSRNDALELSSGRYIQFIDGDDWLIGTNVFQKLIDLMEYYDIIKFECVAEGGRQLPGWDSWQFIWTREIIGDTRFEARTLDRNAGEESVLEAKNFRDAVRSKPHRYLEIPDKLYHYTWGRTGSNMNLWYEGKFYDYFENL